jgi:predicted nucleic acid-binding protein
VTDVLVDASALVALFDRSRVAERDRLTHIVTFDARFRVYALPRRPRFVVLP